jgi:hypothetical protein
MQATSRFGRVSAVGCEELGRLGHMDTSVCCEICHSVDQHVTGIPLGPCHVPAPGGGEALVCCVGKKQLVGAVAVDGASGSEAETRGGSR